jgi:HTH-type transcriptional regulator/antitoxin HigA
MPAYEELLCETKPEAITDRKGYESLHARFTALLRLGSKRTAAETRLMRLLGILIQDYDRRHGMPPDDSTPAERLAFLMEHSGKSSADLASVFGTRSHVSEALNGKRPISADQARKLGKLFCVNPGLFV